MKYEVIYTRGKSCTLERLVCEADSAGDAIANWKAETEGHKVCLLGVGAVKSQYHMVIETDDDFAVRIDGEVYTDHVIRLAFDDPAELNDLEVLGAWGSGRTDSTKCYEFEAGLEQIKSNPGEYFSNLGGNRGVEWIPPKSQQTI